MLRKMSYEPNILIEKEDLLKIEDELDNDQQSVTYERVAMYLLEFIVKDWSFELKGKEYYLLKPEYTSFNEDVRNYLRDKKVEYGVYN